MKEAKPYLLFATPRSGSTLFALIFAEYFYQTQKLKNFYEFFNVNDHSFDFVDGSIRRFCHRTSTSIEGLDYSKPQLEVLRHRIRDQRLEMLKREKNPHFLRAFPNQLNPQTAKWLVDHYEWIILERKNIFENFLSFMVSRTSDQWYLEGGLKIELGSLPCIAKYAKDFEIIYYDFQYWKRLSNASKIVYYEDYLQHKSVSKVLSSVGFNEPFDESRIVLSQKQTVEDKLTYFKKPKEVLKTYRALSLQNVFPR